MLYVVLLQQNVMDKEKDNRACAASTLLHPEVSRVIYEKAGF
jgi:hypothetical protein